MLTKRKPAKMGVRQEQREFPGHAAWVRKHACAVPGCPGGPIEGHHHRKGIPENEAGGQGLKPHDKWLTPLCREHHAEVHSLGADTFDAKHGISLKDVAQWCQKHSPHRIKWERDQ